MKKIYLVIAIIVIAFILIASLVVYVSLRYPVPVSSCEWKLEKDYNIPVNNKQEAVNLLNEYFTQKWSENWKNITTEEINVTENEFLYEGWGVKIDRNGKIFNLFCLI